MLELGIAQELDRRTDLALVYWKQNVIWDFPVQLFTLSVFYISSNCCLHSLCNCKL